MVDKGKKPSNNVDEDELRTLMMECEKLIVSPQPSELRERDISMMDKGKEPSNNVDEYELQKLMKYYEKLIVSPESSKQDFSIRDPSSNNPTVVTEQSSVVFKRMKRKALSPDELANLFMENPSKARRIMINRMSATRAKERKKMYTLALEQRIDTLQTEAAAENARLASLQNETLGWNSQNARLKDDTDTVLLRIQIQDSLNDQMRNETRELRMLLAEMNVSEHRKAETMQNNVNTPAGYEEVRDDEIEQIEHGFKQMNIAGNHMNIVQIQKKFPQRN